MNHETEEMGSPQPAFDPRKGQSIRAQAMGAFEAKQRKILRISGVYLLVLVAFAWWCLRMFNRSNEVQSWIFWGILFLVMIESTVLIKLWFWVLHTKLDVQREVRALRIDLAIQNSSEVALAEAGKVTGTVPRSWTGWEPRLWSLALVLMGLALGSEIALHGPPAGGWMSFREEILSVGGPVTAEPREFQFKPAGRILFLDIRADTQQGTVKFQVLDPEGQDLGWHSGGGMTVNDWRVNATKRGVYTLRVTPRDATGKWSARVQEVQRNPFQRFHVDAK